MRAAIALFVTAGVAIGAGILGFQAGVASNVAATGGTVVVGGAFPLFGAFAFLFFLFLAFMALAALFGARHRHGPWSRYAAMGPGGPYPPAGPWADSRRAWVAEVHRSLHEEEARSSGTASTSGPAA